MSDIKVGDLVVQIRACCSAITTLGYIGTVRHILNGPTLCRGCGQRNEEVHVSLCHPLGGVPVSWVKRIDPLSELDDVKQDEEITA